MFTLNGRSIRQIQRLIKTIYDDIHFYYFHVDEVNNLFLFTVDSLKSKHFNFKANGLSKRRNK